MKRVRLCEWKSENGDTMHSVSIADESPNKIFSATKKGAIRAMLIMIENRIVRYEKIMDELHEELDKLKSK